MTSRTSEVAESCSKASSGSRPFVCLLIEGELGRAKTFCALRREGFGVLGRRPLIRSPPVLERLFIASPWAEGAS
jgi:hypothetical protein